MDKLPTFNPYTGQSKLKHKNIPDYAGQIVFLYPTIKSSCKKKHTSMVKETRFMVADLIYDRKYKVCLYHCDECNQYFTTIHIIRDYIKYGQRLALKYNVVSSTNIRMQSLLNLYGYTVRKNELSDKGRHNLLTHILDCNLVDYDYVVNLLRYLIRFNGKNERCKDAVDLWNNDLYFVIKYHDDERYKRYRIKIIDADSSVCWIHAYGRNNGFGFRLSCSAYASKFPKSFLDNPDLIKFIGERKYEILQLPGRYESNVL